MRTRTCPNCSYKYSISEYLKKLVFKLVYAEWECPGCHGKLTFHYGRRVILALCFGGLTIVFSFLVSILRKTIEMTLVMWVAAIVLFVVFSLFIFTFDTFKTVE
jgi:CXXC-20-CXXC protein